MRIEPARALVGHVAVPGDKSISHRAVLLGAVAEGETRISGFGRSRDTEATIAAVRALGVEVEEHDVDTLTVRGVGLRGLREPEGPIDAGNAGTLMRLLPGLLVGQSGRFELVGDASLSERPLERVAEPLRRMGATVETTDGHAPLVVEGASELQAIDYELPVASAQVKSAILLAALFAEGETTVVEPMPTRDHTERMLERAGVAVKRRPQSVSVLGTSQVVLDEVEIPGDFSSAAPLLVAAAIVPGSDLTVHGVGLNPRRIGLLDVLEHMGAKVAVYNRRSIGGEPAGDVGIRASELVGATVTPAEVPGDGRRASRLRARGGTRARRQPGPRRGRAEVEGDRSHRRRGRGAPPPRRSRPRDGGRLADPRGAGPASWRRLRLARRPPPRHARRRRRRLLEGGCRPSRGRGGRDELPRLLQRARAARASARTRENRSDDRRDRRPGGLGQEHGRAAARGPSRIHLPRHGSHVPRPHLARAPRRRGPRGRRAAGGARARVPGFRRSRGLGRDRGGGRLRASSATARSTGSSRSSRGIPRSAR